MGGGGFLFYFIFFLVFARQFSLTNENKCNKYNNVNLKRQMLFHQDFFCSFLDDQITNYKYKQIIFKRFVFIKGWVGNKVIVGI